MGWLIFFAAMAILLIIVAVEERSDAISAAISEHKLVNSDEWLTEEAQIALDHWFSEEEEEYEEVF